MSHNLHETDGFILGHYNFGEASRLLEILTHRFGLITALAKGVRERHSKLRGHLQDFSGVRVTLVRGREFWRVTGAESLIWPTTLLANSITRSVVARIFSLLRRLIHGEEAHYQLHGELEAALRFLATQQRLSADWLINYELIAVARILHLLGYLASVTSLESFIHFSSWSQAPVNNLSPVRQALTLAVNHSLAESQL